MDGRNLNAFDVHSKLPQKRLQRKARVSKQGMYMVLAKTAVIVTGMMGLVVVIGMLLNYEMTLKKGEKEIHFRKR